MSTPHPPRSSAPEWSHMVAARRIHFLLLPVRPALPPCFIPHSGRSAPRPLEGKAFFFGKVQHREGFFLRICKAPLCKGSCHRRCLRGCDAPLCAQKNSRLKGIQPAEAKRLFCESRHSAKVVIPNRWSFCGSGRSRARRCPRGSGP